MKGLIKYELKKMFSVWWLVYAAAMAIIFLMWDGFNGADIIWPLAVLNFTHGAGDNTNEDEKSGWLALQGILPISKRQYLKVKLLRYGIVSALNFCYIFTLLGIRLAVVGNFGVGTFWMPLTAYLSLYAGLCSTFPKIQSLKGTELRLILLRIGLTVSILGSLAALIVTMQRPDLLNILFPVGIGVLAITLVAVPLHWKKTLDQFEDYQLGIPSELQREDT